jgi:hypothetical protein
LLELQFPRQPSHLPPRTLCRNGRGGATVRRRETAQVDQSRVKTNLLLTLWVGAGIWSGRTPRRVPARRNSVVLARNDALSPRPGRTRAVGASRPGGRDRAPAPPRSEYRHTPGRRPPGPRRRQGPGKATDGNDRTGARWVAFGR